MGHVFFRPGRRLPLAALLPITILWLAFAGSANAAVPNTGTIDQTNNPSTSWQGNLYVESNPLLADPKFCGPTSGNDPNCDHFELTTQDTGPVRVVATWPGAGCATLGTCTGATDNDFDILVCLNGVLDIGEMFPPVQDPITGEFLPNPNNPDNIPPDECTGGTTIAYFPGGTPGFEGGVFAAVGGNTYEIRVLPLSILTPGSDYDGCAEYTDAQGTANACAPAPVIIPPPVSSSAFFQSCADGGTNRQVDGGGVLPAPSSPTGKGNFTINVRRRTDNKGKTHFRGKVRYHEDGSLKFRSEDVRRALFTDGTNTKDDNHNTVFRGKVEVCGFGQLRQDHNREQRVCYKARGEDWGQPGGGRDRFHIEIYSYDPTLDACSALPIATNDGTITDGNVKYKFQPEGKDDP